MTIEKANEALEKEIRCLECDNEYCFITDGLCCECEHNVEVSELVEAIKVAIKALKAIDEDLIRRQDALNCFHAWIDKHGDVQEPDDMAEYRAIENLPAVMEEME